MNKTRILIAEDDPHIRMGLADTLESESYEVVEAADGQDALDKFNAHPPQLILLDVMMPGLSGYDVCREIRAKGSSVPVIMLTAKGEEIDKVVGLELGADDYMTKPFGVHELLARIKAVLRRSHPAPYHPRDQDCFDFGPFQVDPRRYTLTRGRLSQSISRRELDLIQLFAGHRGEVLDREFILTRIWGMAYAGTTRTLDQHIAQLRKKLAHDGPGLITTVHGIGYRYGDNAGGRAE